VVVSIVAFAVAVAPVFEEFFFRGFAYPALKQRWGTWRALVIVSAAFAAIHLHVPSLGPLFALAIGLGLSYEFTGSLLAPITVHALFNTVNVGMLLYVRAHS
jgi:membrane protease YdiL (CAAX protease family)